MDLNIQKIHQIYGQTNILIAREKKEVDRKRIEKMLSHIYSPGPSYQFILDLPTVAFNFVSESVQEILGVDPAEFSPQHVFDRIHPHDRDHYVHCEEIAREFLINQIDPVDIPHYKISFQFRMKRKVGYKLFLHQVIPIEWDENGNFSKVFGNHSDIDHITTSNNRKVSIIGLIDRPSYFGIEKKEDLDHYKSVLIGYTRREVEILRLISGGLSTQQIAGRLNISEGTVRTHRKNILSKSEHKNTVCMVASAIREGII